MIQSCGKSIALPLKLLFKQYLKREHFQKIGKKVMYQCTRRVQEFDKKLSTYLSSHIHKILEILIFNSMFNFSRQNNLFTKCQSGFVPGDSCVAQLLSITHEIYQSFDCSPTRDIEGVFLDISKHFDKFWHEIFTF